MTDYERNPDAAAFVIRFASGFALGAAIGAAPFAFLSNPPARAVLTSAGVAGAGVGLLTVLLPGLWRWLRASALFVSWLWSHDWRNPPPDL